MSTVPAIHSTLGEDTPRTRRTDPSTSHTAADASQRHIKEAKQRVLTLVRELTVTTGTELNETYPVIAERRGWKHLAFDSPRKRAGELADDGYLDVVGFETGTGNNLPESIYAITPKGLNALGLIPTEGTNS